MTESVPGAEFRCGHIAIVGRPNVGKSTLLNRLVGAKVSITSKKAQTTRHRITGIRTTADTQFIFVDTPGFQTRHRSRLNERMNRAVTQSLADVDAVVLVIEAGRTVAADHALLPQMADLARIRDFAAIVPLSAATGRDIDRLSAEIRKLLPPSPPLFGADEITDRDERFLAAELIREKIFRLLGDEVPYAATVVVEEFKLDGELRRIEATVYVERDNQRIILIGSRGDKMKEIAASARAEMERLFGGKVFLEIWVRVKKDWADSEASLKRLGY
jgi:GTPase